MDNNTTSKNKSEIDMFNDDEYPFCNNASSKLDKVMADIQPGIYREYSMEGIEDLLGM